MPRDTQFAGFAKLLMMELFGQDDYIDVRKEDHKDIAQYEHVIAQRAYDLVLHTLLNVEHINLDRLEYEEHVERIPDLTEWPKD